MRKISKQIFQGQRNSHHVYFNVFFWFSFINTSLSCLLFLFFSLFNFDFTIFSLCYSIKYLGKPKLWSSTIGQFGKTAFTAEFLTVANTLSMYWSKNTQPTNIYMIIETISSMFMYLDRLFSRTTPDRMLR